MLAGLDGAHASPPEASSVWLAAGSSAIPTASAAPTTLSPQQSGTAPSAQQPIDATPTAVAPCPTRTEDGKVIVNRAGLEDLRKIPGIGPKRAEAILALRTKLKRFKRSSDLLRIKGIGPKSLVRMQPHFVLDDPKGDSCAIAPSAKQ
jgi:competence protein ComEA